MPKEVKIETLIAIRNHCKSIIDDYVDLAGCYELLIKENGKWLHDWDTTAKTASTYNITNVELNIDDDEIVIDATGKIEINHAKLTVAQMQALIMLSSTIRLGCTL